MAVLFSRLALVESSLLWSGCSITTPKSCESKCVRAGYSRSSRRVEQSCRPLRQTAHGYKKLNASTNSQQRRLRRDFSIRASQGDDERIPYTGTEDLLLQGLSENAEVSVYAIVGTNLVREAQFRHRTTPTATAALGRALMGTLLLGAFRKGNETVQVTFMGDGPLGQMTVVANSELQVKGLVGNPACDLPLNAQGKLDVGGAVGPGVLTVVRNSPNWKQPYSGSVDIVCGEVAEDLTHYLAESEQQNSAMGLGVLVGTDCLVAAAGGFLVQVLPFCSEETLSILEANVTALPSPTNMLMAGLDAKAIIARIFNGLGEPEFSASAVPSFGPCGKDNLRQRMMRTLVLLGPQQVKEVLEEQGAVEVKCEFCSEVIRFEEEDLRPALALER